jgi:hypothetical protein
MSAITLMRSRSYLGAQYRRLRTRLGAPKAITAMAHRLARLFYQMQKHGPSYVDKGREYYEQRYRNHQLHQLRKQAARLGLRDGISKCSRRSGREGSLSALATNLFTLVQVTKKTNVVHLSF